MKERYIIKIEPLTAVHIGTGNELTPLDYKVTRTKQGNLLYIKFSSDKILKRLIETENQQKLKQFEIASAKGNMKELQMFFQNNVDSSSIEYPCEATSEFVQLYNANSQKDPLDNALCVLQMYRPEGDKTPVITGSSLKGSVRTAVLNSILYNIPDGKYNELKEKFSKLDERKQKNFDSDLQKALLGNYKDAKAEPFRGIRFFDCTFPAKDSQIIVRLDNVSVDKYNEKLKTTGMQILAEAIKGKLLGTNLCSECYAEIDSDLFSTNQIVHKLTMENIVKACNEFFKIQFDNEYEKFYEHIYDGSCNFVNKLKQIIEETANSKNSFVVRLGRWSQVEFVTFGSDFRKPKTPVRKGKVMPYGTSRTVLNYNDQYLPMGWCKCTVEKL